MYATRGGGPESHTNKLTTQQQYFDDFKSQPGKARGKGGRPMAAMKGDFRKQQATPYHMNPDVPHIKNPKPVANDLLRELLSAPGGLDKMNQQQQYGKLVEMRQRQAKCKSCRRWDVVKDTSCKKSLSGSAFVCFMR